MNKKNNNKGFTLAELLIVVAIIAVLVAIAIPVFTSQLEKSREATDMANIRAAYAEITVKAIDDPAGAVDSKVINLKQTVSDWQTTGANDNLTQAFGSGHVSGNPTKGGTATVAWTAQNGTTDGYCSVTFAAAANP